MSFDYYLTRVLRFVARKTLPQFKTKISRVLIEFPRRIEGSRYITLGDNTHLGPGSSLVAITHFSRLTKKIVYNPEVIIGRGVTATAALQIHAAKRVVIEDNVLLATNVFICDCSHGISDMDTAVMDQPYENLSEIRIGTGSWLGQNVVIMPGVTIGKHCVIGANSVVRSSIPDYSMAVGAPARVVKVYDSAIGCWSKL